MAKNKNNFKRRTFSLFKFLARFFPEKLRLQTLGILMLLVSIVLVFSFFDLAGKGGKFMNDFSRAIFGKGVFVTPFIFAILGVSFLFLAREHLPTLIFAGFILMTGVSGVLGVLGQKSQDGGGVGEIFSKTLVSLFGTLVSEIFFLIIILVSILIFGQFFLPIFPLKKEEEEKTTPSLFKKVIGGLPRFKVSELEATKIKEEKREIKKTEAKDIEKKRTISFLLPPLDLLEEDKEEPQAGDIQQNSFLIKKTLRDFGIEVTMAQANVGPTVTQYTLKPPEGVRLSKITALSNNLALALAAHPIRIEAPIPGKPLVGIEIPNKIRSRVRLRNLISHPDFRKFSSGLGFCLGKDVAGNPLFNDLAKLPHLLVAGATGTGKTIFLNSLILSLLYQNGISTLRFILIDPKRVEFTLYAELPHLLCPVILDPQRAVNSLKWLIGEMERRFDLLSESQTKDIKSFNDIAQKNGLLLLPYIIVIIDELADLMAARGKEIESGIVRLAQMARAVGIHLVIATQRPSVDVLTGLIKANITSRVAFQVASHFDSRTILDTGGAEKLLGQGDLLYLSAQIIKPKRIQGAFVSEDEIKRIVNYIKSEFEKERGEFKYESLKNNIREDLEKTLNISKEEKDDSYFKEDILYEEAKRVVIEAKKASASLLQRRLGIGYARAARLLDILEGKGIIGPSQGAKPREVYES